MLREHSRLRNNIIPVKAQERINFERVASCLRCRSIRVQGETLAERLQRTEANLTGMFMSLPSEVPILETMLDKMIMIIPCVWVP